jgi:hypothetical protein
VARRRPLAGRPSSEGAVKAFGSRGVWVPKGMAAAEIMAGAAALQKRFKVDHYEARSMARAVLEAARAFSKTRADKS